MDAPPGGFGLLGGVNRCGGGALLLREEAGQAKSQNNTEIGQDIGSTAFLCAILLFADSAFRVPEGPQP
jgi:hypothetical protein